MKNGFQGKNKTLEGQRAAVGMFKKFKESRLKGDTRQPFLKWHYRNYEDGENVKRKDRRVSKQEWNTFNPDKENMREKERSMYLWKWK